MAAPVFAVGDVHGHRDVLAGLLRDAGLVDAGESWTGADARLWLVGDLVDRGPDGIGAIELVRRLEGESGGAVRCLLGNHEAMILAALRFGDEETSFGEQTFREIWTLNGGVDSDLDALTPEHVAWLTALPPLAREGDWLVVHADTTAYLELGTSIDAVARATSTALATGDAASVDELLGILSDRMRLGDPEAVEALALRLRRLAHRPRAHADRLRPPCRAGRCHRAAPLRRRARHEHRPLPVRRWAGFRSGARGWARPGGLTHPRSFRR